MNRPAVYIEHDEELDNLRWLELVLDLRLPEASKDISIPFPIGEKMCDNPISIGKRGAPIKKALH